MMTKYQNKKWFHKWVSWIFYTYPTGIVLHSQQYYHYKTKFNQRIQSSEQSIRKQLTFNTQTELLVTSCMLYGICMNLRAFKAYWTNFNLKMSFDTFVLLILKWFEINFSQEFRESINIEWSIERLIHYSYIYIFFYLKSRRKLTNKN